jgi:hypothetical protein
MPTYHLLFSSVLLHRGQPAWALPSGPLCTEPLAPSLSRPAVPLSLCIPVSYAYACLHGRAGGARQQSRQARSSAENAIQKARQPKLWAVARLTLFPLAVIFFCRFACLSRQMGGGQSHRQTVQLGQNFKVLPNKSYCS